MEGQEEKCHNEVLIAEKHERATKYKARHYERDIENRAK